MTRPIIPIDEQRVREFIREELLDFATGGKLGDPLRHRRHYEIFYTEMRLHAEALAGASPEDRARFLAGLARIAHEQELAEREAQHRADDPDGMTSCERITSEFSRLFERPY